MEQGGMSAHDDEVAYELQMAAAVDATLKDARMKEAQFRKMTDQKVALELAMHELQLAMVALETGAGALQLRAPKPRRAVAAATCEICLELKPGHRFQAVKACKHSFCRACLSLYVSSKAAAPVRCPQPGCAAHLCREDFRGLKLAPAVAARVLPPAADEDPDAAVSAALRDARCEVKFAEMVAERGWKACPTCSRVIERTGGCNTVECRCGTMFCYNCGEDLARCEGCGNP